MIGALFCRCYAMKGGTCIFILDDIFRSFTNISDKIIMKDQNPVRTNKQTGIISTIY
jgi:hypothetical protein